jgi:hypothetical protein
MGRKQAGDEVQRKGRRTYVRGPRWSGAQFHMVNSVIEGVLSNAPKISIADLYRRLCYYHKSRLGGAKIHLPSRSTFYRYVRWLSSPDPRFQLRSRADSRLDQIGVRALGQPDAGEQHSIFQADYKLMDADGTVLFDSTAPTPQEPAPVKLYLPGSAIVQDVDAHYDGNILRIDNLWLGFAHPDGNIAWFPYTGHTTRKYYRELSLN